MEMYERIRELRKKELGLSQEEFGKKLGVSRSVINNIERNVLARPEQKEPLIKLICKEFGVNEEWLRTGEGGDDNIYIKHNPRFNEAIGRLHAENDTFKQEIIAMLLDELDEDDWNAILRIVNKFIDIKKSKL